MPEIKMEVLNEFFGKNRSTEYASALSEAGDDLEKQSEIHKKFLQEKADEVKNVGKDEGKGWGKREALKEIETELKNNYSAEGSTYAEMIKNIAASKSSGKKTLTAEEIKALPTFKDLVEEEVKELKSTLTTFQDEVTSLKTAQKRNKISKHFDRIAEKALEGKKVKSERQKAAYIRELWSLADDFDEVEDRLIALDKEGNAVKDKLHNQLDISLEAVKIAGDYFDDLDPAKVKLANLGKPSSTSTFKVPKFEGNDAKQQAADWYDSLDDESKKAYQEHLISLESK